METENSGLIGSKPLSSQKLVLLAMDLLFFTGVYNVIHYFRLGVWVEHFSAPYIGVMLIVFASLYVFDAYGGSSAKPRTQLAIRSVFSIFAAALCSTAFVYVLGPQQFGSVFGRGVLPVTLFLFGIWAGLSRLLWVRQSSIKSYVNNWLFVGNIEAFKQLHKEFGFPQKSVEILSDDCVTTEIRELGFEVLGNEKALEKIEDSGWKEVVFASDKSLTEGLVASVMSLRQRGAKIYDLSAFYEDYLAKVPVLQLDSGWFLQGGGFSLVRNQSGFRLKRILDYSLSITLFILIFPLMLLVCALVKLTSQGPVFYRQTRVGLNGSQFQIIKFRTMIDNAEVSGAQWASEQDPRITPLGKFLRVTRIDELPQLFNVLKGEMSFIGPRPERPEFVHHLEREIPHYEIRHLVLPGITGWAQVMYPYGASIEDARQKLQYDLFYIKNYSLLLDFSILIKTVKTILMRSGR